MITRNIPKDISKYKTKLMLGLTTRQVVLLAPGAALAVAVYFLTRNSLGNFAMFLALITALPFLAFASFKPLGMPLEQFIKTALLPMLLAPVKRKYVSENTYDAIIKRVTSEVQNEASDAKDGSKKAPQKSKKQQVYKSKNKDIYTI